MGLDTICHVCNGSGKIKSMDEALIGTMIQYNNGYLIKDKDGKWRDYNDVNLQELENYINGN
jgi:hypothetical protein